MLAQLATKKSWAGPKTHRRWGRGRLTDGTRRAGDAKDDGRRGLFPLLSTAFQLSMGKGTARTVTVVVCGVPAVRVMVRWTWTCWPWMMIFHAPDWMAEYGIPL